MRMSLDHWPFWALMSAVSKIGVEKIDSNFSTLIRTVVILAVVAAIAVSTNALQPLASVTPKSYLFLALSGLATGASWLCYFRALKLGPASQVAPVDKLSVVFVAVLSVIFLGEHLSLKHCLAWRWCPAARCCLSHRSSSAPSQQNCPTTREARRPWRRLESDDTVTALSRPLRP